jgi:hypothetical protein
MSRNLQNLLITLLLVVALSACSAPGTAPASKTPGSAGSDNTLPTEAQQNIAGYPGYPTVAVQASGVDAYPVVGETAIPTLMRYKPGELPPAPVDAPQPEKGKASISGTLFSFTSQQLLPQTLYYLTPAQGDNNNTPPAFATGPQPEKGDISATSDEKGQFQLNNIPPGNYFLFVWSAYNWPLAVVSATDSAPRLIELKADQKTLLGVVYVSWP